MTLPILARLSVSDVRIIAAADYSDVNSSNMRVTPELVFTSSKGELERTNTGERKQEKETPMPAGRRKTRDYGTRLVSRCLREKKRVKLVDRKVRDYAVRV